MSDHTPVCGSFFDDGYERCENCGHWFSEHQRPSQSGGPMSARDDLVAAEARLFEIATGLRGYADSRGDPVDSEMNEEAFYLESVARLIPSLLALLDAEPVGYTLQREDGTFAGGFWLPRDIDHAEEEARKSWEWGNNYSVAALYARPEAAPAKRRTKGQWTELGWIPQPEASDE